VLRATDPTRWPGAVSTLAAALVAGPERQARVLGAFPSVVYLAVDAPIPRTSVAVLPILAADALALPTGIRLGVGSADLGWVAELEDQAGEGVVGQGQIRFGRWRIDAVRTWLPAQVARAPVGSRAVSLDRTDELRPHTAEVVRHARLARRLVGRGRGLTPSGDDALCGAMLVLRAVGSPALGPVREHVVASLQGTTSLSASFLAAAGGGYAVPAAARLASALAAGDAPAAQALLAEALAIGHTSGSDLVAGMLGALDATATGAAATAAVGVNTPQDSRRVYPHSAGSLAR
jgi:Protein of unknown function (DUF2877)